MSSPSDKPSPEPAPHTDLGPTPPDAARNAPESTATADNLPAVVAPTAGFLLQLFFIPLLIVCILVAVWVMIDWLAHAGSNPEQLVKKLKRGDPGSWQAAVSLTNMLRDPRQAHLKHDHDLAKKLAQELERQHALGPPSNDNQTKTRMYVCCALGEFHAPEALAPLVKTGQKHRNSNELDVRRAAILGLGKLAINLEVEELRRDKEVMKTLLEASKERSENPDERHSLGRLRAWAAFALGVIGGKEALDRLNKLLIDSHLDARINAATGLARYGDQRALPVLLEMLDAENEDVGRREPSESVQEYKQGWVNVTGVRAVEMFARKNSKADMTKIQQALEKLSESSGPQSIRAEALKTLHVLETRQAKLTKVSGFSD